MTKLTRTPSLTQTPNADRTPKPLRFKIGIGLFVVYALSWVAIVVMPFLPLDGGSTAAVIGVIVVVAEVILLIAIALVGKEAYQAFKARFLRRKTVGAQAGEGATDA